MTKGKSNAYARLPITARKEIVDMVEQWEKVRDIQKVIKRGYNITPHRTTINRIVKITERLGQWWIGLNQRGSIFTIPVRFGQLQGQWSKKGQ